MSRINAHHSPRSESVDWLSPPEWIERLGPFDLDPCCPTRMPWRTARRMVTRREDGLACQWKGRVWCNPPYGRPPVIEPWMQRMAEHGNGIALSFARTETHMWFEYVWPVATAILFVRGRPYFYRRSGRRAVGNSGGPVSLIAYGESNARALERANIEGYFLRPGKFGKSRLIRSATDALSEV